MLANFQFQVHVQLAAGKVLLVVDLCVGSPTSLAQYAHAHFHPSTTLLPSRDFPIQALLFPNFTSISFFIPPINTVFYLIERIIQYFILLNDCDKEQKKESLCRGYHLGVNNDIFYLAHGSKYILCTADLSDLLTLSDLLWARYHFGVGVNLSWQSCIHCWSSFSLSRGLRTGLSCGVGSCGTELSSCRHKRFDMFNLVI